MPSAQKVGIENLASGGSKPTSRRRSLQYNFVSLPQATMPKPKGKMKRLLGNFKNNSQVHVLFTIAKTWKQPKCLSTDEWIKKNVVHMHDGVLLSH